MLRRGVTFEPIKWTEKAPPASDTAADAAAAPQTDPAPPPEADPIEMPARLRNRIAAALKLRSAN
jgi:hypothetical protein